MGCRRNSEWSDTYIHISCKHKLLLCNFERKSGWSLETQIHLYHHHQMINSTINRVRVSSLLIPRPTSITITTMKNLRLQEEEWVVLRDQYPCFPSPVETSIILSSEIPFSLRWWEKEWLVSRDQYPRLSSTFTNYHSS